ncbi:MAG: Flp pilus assembly protein CpaB [Anaerolineae bacterium]|nr:Flp pilus assembly protein CpaB [Anaerolineae bacterium]
MARRGGSRTAMIIIIVLIVVVLLAGGGLLLLRGAGGGLMGAAEPAAEANVPPTPTPEPQTMSIIIAARDIPRGSRLTAQDVTIMSWPLIEAAPPPYGALVVGDEQGAGLDQVEGRIARVDILYEQPVLDFMITPGDEPMDLADLGSDAALKVPQGMVAVAVPIQRLSAVAYALREGDHVDIMMSFNFVDIDEEFQTILPNQGLLFIEDIETGEIDFLEYPLGREEVGVLGQSIIVVPNGEQVSKKATQLIIDNAIVMRVGDWPLRDLNQPIIVTPEPVVEEEPVEETEEGEAPAGEPTPTPVPAIQVPDVITLAMTRQDALVLKYATEVGANIDYALRSALDDDIEDIETDTVTLGYIVNFYNVTPPEKEEYALDSQVGLLSQFAPAETVTEVPPPSVD